MKITVSQEEELGYIKDKTSIMIDLEDNCSPINSFENVVDFLLKKLKETLECQ